MSIVMRSVDRIDELIAEFEECVETITESGAEDPYQYREFLIILRMAKEYALEHAKKVNDGE